jgi:hypothetical protein
VGKLAIVVLDGLVVFQWDQDVGEFLMIANIDRNICRPEIKLDTVQGWSITKQLKKRMANERQPDHVRTAAL